MSTHTNEPDTQVGSGAIAAVSGYAPLAAVDWQCNPAELSTPEAAVSTPLSPTTMARGKLPAVLQK